MSTNGVAEETVVCSKCDIDAVIGSASGLPIDATFLAVMRDYWFGETEDEDVAAHPLA